MDELNRKIIDELKRDSRTPFLGIAKKLKVSEGTIRKRVSKLQDSKSIKKFTIETGDEIMAIVGIETKSQMDTQKIALQMRDIGADRVYEVTGRFDIICWIAADNMTRINDLLEKIRQTQGVVHTETFSVLKVD